MGPASAGSQAQSGDIIPNSGEVPDARPGIGVLGNSTAGWRKVSRPLSSWVSIELVGRNWALVGFSGIKNRPSPNIGRKIGGDAPKLGRESNQRRSENDDSNCS